jgi:hypothetical protein
VIDSRPNEKFGLSLEKRMEIFREFADAEPAARSKGHALFADQPWSAEDDRAATEHHLAHAMSIQRGISLTRIYLALTEGIANHWVGSDGQPLVATTEPLQPRQK